MLQQDYVSADETYHKVLLAKTKPTDKGSKKGYLWAVSAPKLGLVFFVYEDGSRSEQVILNVFSDYKGTIQSDAYAPYRKLESDAYPDIMRIACLHQHVAWLSNWCHDDIPYSLYSFYLFLRLAYWWQVHFHGKCDY